MSKTSYDFLYNTEPFNVSRLQNKNTFSGIIPLGISRSRDYITIYLRIGGWVVLSSVAPS